MRNITILFSFLAFILIAAGCQSGDVIGPSTADAFIGGTSALNIKFLENAPPSEVTDKKAGETGFPFKAVVTIENIGEFTIPADQLTVKLTGFFPDDFLGAGSSGLSNTYDKAFNGVRKDPDGNRIQGDINQLTFPDRGDLEYQSELAGNQIFPFRAEACYLYQTRAISQICLQEDLTAKDPKVCDPSGSKSVDNSGSPVHVTSVTQSIGGKSTILLHFTVRKVGSSEVFSQPACSTTFESEDRVAVTVNTGISGLDCFGFLDKDAPNIGQLRLDNGQASFTCRQPLEGNSKVDSIKTIDIFLDYYAQDSITTTVLVKHLI